MIINWGDAPFKAFITVSYPNGTCTVSLGDKSFSHTGGGTHTFAVNKKGTWTVKATDGTDTHTKTVNITSRNQAESVELYYRLYFYRRGNLCNSVSGGWGYNSTTHAIFNADHIWLKGGGYTGQSTFVHSGWAVPAKYTRMVIVGEVVSTYSNGVCFESCGLTRAGDWAITGGVWHRGAPIGGFTQTVNISAPTTAGDRLVKIRMGAVESCVGKIYEVYFLP